MFEVDFLFVAGLALAFIHFGVPLAYYGYARFRWLGKSWNIAFNPNYKPRVTVIIPTYNEAMLIQKKLNNIYEQDYPKELMEIIVVDSASNDGTPELVEEWASEHKDANLKLLKEPKRSGMVPALNYVLRNYQVNGEVVIFTDADAVWDPDALTKVVKYFADPNIGAVTASIIPITPANDPLEETYRNYYNSLRVAESKACSTPVHNAALMAFRKNVLYEMSGLPEYTGNNDSTPASIAAFMGYRAIQADDVVVKEFIRTRGGQLHRKVRRAQHLLLNFLKTKQYVKELGVYRPDRLFEKIWKVEWWLHVINPWLLALSVTLFTISAFRGSFMSVILLGMELAFLALRIYRAWILQQLYLIIAAIRNLWTREIIWSK